MELGIKNLGGRIKIIDPLVSEKKEAYSNRLFELRHRKGLSLSLALEALNDPYYYASLMVELGDADALLGGVSRPYGSAVRPVLEVIRVQSGRFPAGIYMLVADDKIRFLGDCTVNIDPTAEELAEIALSTVEVAKDYTSDPIRVAMLSFASFGSNRHVCATKVAKAVEIIKKRAPELEIDGEMQADVALDRELREGEFPFANLSGDANVLIFPNLDAANISYKLLKTLGGVQVMGPIIAGMNKPANIVQRGASVREIVNLLYITAHQWA